MNIFMVNESNEAAESLVKKLSGKKDGLILLLTDAEMKLYRSDDFKCLSFGSEGTSNIVKMEQGKSYLYVCDQFTNIDDVMRASEILGFTVAIVRTDQPKEKLQVM